jgi:hypothetical protein
MLHANAGRLGAFRIVLLPLVACLLLSGCEPSGVGTIKSKGDGKPSTDTLLPAPDGKMPKKGIPPLSGPTATPKDAGK